MKTNTQLQELIKERVFLFIGKYGALIAGQLNYDGYNHKDKFQVSTWEKGGNRVYDAIAGFSVDDVKTIEGRKIILK